MSSALELREVSKRFVVGAGGCLGSVEALRSVDLAVEHGEAVAIAGGPGAGKSTLLLVAAGLLRVDSGDVSWFGRHDRVAGVERASYYYVGSSSPQRTSPASAQTPHIHLVDSPEALRLAGASRMERWIERRRSAGDAVVIATRSVESARELVARTLVLRAGRLCVDDRAATSARVAEAVDWARR